MTATVTLTVLCVHALLVFLCGRRQEPDNHLCLREVIGRMPESSGASIQNLPGNRPSVLGVGLAGEKPRRSENISSLLDDTPAS